MFTDQRLFDSLHHLEKWAACECNLVWFCASCERPFVGPAASTNDLGDDLCDTCDQRNAGQRRASCSSCD